MNPYRRSGGLFIDTGEPLEFEFDGQPFTGYRGDTLQSALMANGVWLMGRSFKRHRPRGPISAGLEEPNALVQVLRANGDQSNLRATEVQLCDGLKARSQNRWPGLKWDVAGLLNDLSPMMPPGFYHKMFMWPSWGFYEPHIRRMAGLGPAPVKPATGQFKRRKLHADVLIIGAGPVGLSIAGSLAGKALQVCLLDDQPRLGGSASWTVSAQDWLAGKLEALKRAENITVMTSTRAFGVYEHGLVGAVQTLSSSNGSAAGEILWHIRADRTIHACGAIERPLLFENNDTPGIMLAESVRRLAAGYGVIPGDRLAIATNNDGAYLAAKDLLSLGINVVGVLDCRDSPTTASNAFESETGVRVFQGTRPLKAQGALRLKRLRFGASDGGGRSRIIDCDALGVSGGWSPSVQLFSQGQGRLEFDDAVQAYRPHSATRYQRCAGAANGEFGLSGGERDAQSALQWAVGESGGGPLAEKLWAEQNNLDFSIAAERLPPGKTARQWVDFQHDVTVKDLQIAIAEGMTSPEHLKRYTTSGMSVDQGKLSSHATLHVLAETTGQSMREMKPTTYRPPFHPVTLAALAGGATGPRYRALRRLPGQAWHQSVGARLVDEGGWERPACYPRCGETQAQARDREVLAVRKSIGVFDSSSLGKIEVRGPDAAQFLERIYFNAVSTLKPGRARYGLMLNERGAIVNDGIFVRLTEGHFLLFTTSGGAENVYRAMERYRQVEWPGLHLSICPVTEQWASITISGPDARHLLIELDSGGSLDTDNFPHMSLQSGSLGGISARVLRASYTGELQFEINVPAGQAERLLEGIWAAGMSMDICAYGLDAQSVLRLEKGFIEYGIDTVADTIPHDIGMVRGGALKSHDFVGRRSLEMGSVHEQPRLQLVGLQSESTLPVGAHAGADNDRSIPQPSAGFVTSSAWSPTLDRPIALALIRGGRSMTGQRLTLYSCGKWYEGTVVQPAFFDPKGSRASS